MWYGNFGKSKRKDVYKIDKRYERSYTYCKLNELLPPAVGHVRERDTRLIQIYFIILNVEPNVLAIVFSVCIRKYNIAIDNL